MSMFAVAGATGKQGGGVVQALLERGLKVRALTRTTHSPRAQALAAQGVELAVADFDKPETLQAALQGTDGAFIVTNYWEYMDAEREIRQATALFNAAKAAGLQHIVWSGLEDTRPETEGKLTPPDGKYPVPHFDAKGVASQQLVELGVPYTIVQACAFMDNFLEGMKPQAIGQDKFGIFSNMGDKPLALIAPKDIGEVAATVLQQGPSKWAGQTLSLAGDHLTWPEAAKVLSEVTGKDIQGITLPDDAFVEALKKAGMPESGAQDLANMFHWYREWSDSYLARHSVEATKKVYPGVQSFKEWAQNNKDALIKAMSG